MRNKEKEQLAVLRLITAAVKQIEVDQRIELDDAQMLGVLDKLAKQHRDSIEQYKNAGRDDLVEKEEYELSIVSNYLPEALSEDEINQLIDEGISATGAEGMKDMGKVMGIIKSKAQGRADMGALSGLVKAKLS